MRNFIIVSENLEDEILAQQKSDLDEKDDQNEASAEKKIYFPQTNQNNENV